MKSVTTFVVLAVIVLLVGAALPDSPGAMRFLGVLAFVSALAWVALTIWWFLRLRSRRRRPARELRTIETPGPRWLRMGVAVLCVPVVLGFLAILYKNGVSGPVLIGAIVGPAIGVLVHRRHLRRRSQLGGGQ
ncbi:MAG: hypothetical protein ACRDSL_17800 [Pseudonocardiaceae bacterium]